APVPSLAGAAEGAGAKARALDTMDRGDAFAVVDAVRAPRGMPWAASGDRSALPKMARVTRRNRDIPEPPQGIGPDGPATTARAARLPMGEEGFEPPTSCV